jgi:anti-anti-sigma factor
MEVSVHDHADCTIVALQGRFIMEAALQLREQLQSILEQAKPILVVNLASVDYIDSSGTGVLVSLLHGARESKRRLILTQLHPNVERVFTLSNLTKVFEIARTEDEAFQMVHPKRIFLLEDREDIVYFYQEVVQANQMGFEHSSDARQAVALMKERPADLIILDVLEKESAKYDFVRALKQDARLKSIPIVVLSVYEEEEFQYSQFGVDRFILKPFLVEKFVATLKQLLARVAKD